MAGVGINGLFDYKSTSYSVMKIIFQGEPEGGRMSALGGQKRRPA
jgi:hypothetical protein